MRDSEQAQFEAEIAAAVACSPRLSAFKSNLIQLVEPVERELFVKLLGLTLQSAYAEGMRAGTQWMLDRK